jgi:two-component system, OmpR family, sensor histidine kinase BaeS
MRVFAVVTLVALVAIATTAWLTLTVATRHFQEESTDVERNRLNITLALQRYARSYGSWVGVSTLVARLSAANGQRIRLETIDGEVITDTDHLNGRAARPVVSTPAFIDTAMHPPTSAQVPPVTGVVVEADAVRAMWDAIRQYRDSVRTLVCLRREGLSESAFLGEEPPYLPPGLGAAPECRTDGRSTTAEIRADVKTTAACVGRPQPSGDDCLQKAFSDRTRPLAAQPARLYLGAVDDQPSQLLNGYTIAGAAGILILAFIGTALAARRLGGPIRRLTVASGHLANGNLDIRVPESGRDELTRLSRSFNRMAEAIQQSERRQQRLVADVAHELRTPLSNVSGYLEALQDGVVEPTPEVFASLHEETQLQRRILDDLQVLALAEAGTLTYRWESVELAGLLEAAETAHRTAAADRGVRLLVDAQPGVRVVGDPQRLRQVLSNLITNAVRHTPPGGRVLLQAWAPDAGPALIAVTDTGCGIAAADVAHVFDRFWRADPARQRSTGGSGLGLTIARRIVLDHGGGIEVRSRLDAGTTFTITLPPAEPEPPAAEPPAAPATVPRIHWRPAPGDSDADAPTVAINGIGRG